MVAAAISYSRPQTLSEHNLSAFQFFKKASNYFQFSGLTSFCSLTLPVCCIKIWQIKITQLIDRQVQQYSLPQKPPSVISSSNTSVKPRPAFNLASRPSMNCNHKFKHAY